MTKIDNERTQLDIVLKEQPGFIIRYGLVVFIAVVCILIIFAYYSGYDIMSCWQIANHKAATQ